MTTSVVIAGAGQSGGSGGTPPDNLIGGQDDFNTFHPLEDSPLNVDPEDAGELADTDNYRGPSENAILQDINEALADIDPVELEEIQEEVAAALEDLHLIPMLQEYQRHFKKRGVGIADVAALESHYPGLLLANAPDSYSYKPSMANSEYSQEAIGEKIDALIAKGKAALDKLIRWIKDTCKKVAAKYNKERFNLTLAKLKKAIANKETRLAVNDISRLLHNDTVSYDHQHLVETMSRYVGRDLTLADFSGIPGKSTPEHWIRAVDQLKTEKAKPMVIPYDIKKYVMSIRNDLLAVDNNLASRSEDPHANSFLIQQAQLEDDLDPRSIATFHGLYKTLTSSNIQEALHDGLTDIAVTVARFEEKLDREGNSDDKDIKANRKIAYDKLRGVSNVVQRFTKCLQDYDNFLWWVGYSLSYVTKENVDRIIDAAD